MDGNRRWRRHNERGRRSVVNKVYCTVHVFLFFAMVLLASLQRQAYSDTLRLSIAACKRVSMSTS
jgi:hypothetical protein